MRTKKFLGMLLAAAMFFSLGAVTVFAEGETESADTYTLANAALTKDFQVADGVNISSDNTFTFSFTAVSSTTAANADHPVIANQTVTVGTQSDDHAYGSLTLDNVFDINYFSHAGEYVYTVEEVSGSNENITYDSNEYTLHIYVINGENGLEFSGVTVEDNGEKIDPTIKQGENTSGFNFKNIYKENLENTDGVLKITKTVTGSYGDKTKTFPVTVTLILPSTADAEKDVSVADGAVWNVENLTATADLKNNTSIVFTKLPAGTKFNVEETQDIYYDGRISGDFINEQTFAAGVNVTASSTNPIVDNSGKNIALTNNRDNVIPTGVIINNLPYVLLAAVAGIGITFIVLKKKRAGI